MNNCGIRYCAFVMDARREVQRMPQLFVNEPLVGNALI